MGLYRGTPKCDIPIYGRGVHEVRRYERERDIRAMSRKEGERDAIEIVGKNLVGQILEGKKMVGLFLVGLILAVLHPLPKHPDESSVFRENMNLS